LSMSYDKPIENTDMLPKPLNWLANDIIELNKRWIRDDNQDTIGAENIRKDDFTRNQRFWMNKLAEKINYKNRRISYLEEQLEEMKEDD